MATPSFMNRLQYPGRGAVARPAGPYRSRLACVAHGGPRPRLGGLDLAMARRGAGDERVEEPVRHRRDLVDGAAEGRRVGLRRSREPAQLADELERGGADLLVRGRWREVVQRLDASTHDGAPCRP